MAYQPKTKEFESKEGNKYTFQSVMNSKALEILDKGTDSSGRILNSKMTELMLDNVVVIPAGLKADDFETLQEVEEVASAAFLFFRTGR